jgi:hypothetical protein
VIRLPRKRSHQKASGPSQKLLGYARTEDIQALFELLGMVASVPGWMPHPEITEIERFMVAQVPSTEREFAIACFLKGLGVAKMREAAVKRAFQLYGFRDYSEPDRWLEPLQVLDIMLRVAFADGHFSVMEEHIIDYTRQTLGVHNRAFWVVRDTLADRYGVHIPREGASFKRDSSEDFKQRANRNETRIASLSREDALQRLGLPPSASAAEIKTRYRALVKECHPDLVAAKGTEAQIQAAALRFCELREAYESLGQ